jgi:predicted transcriptional regulator
MNIVLSLETQQLLEQRMKQRNYSSPDEAVRDALEMSEEAGAVPDPETVAAIREGMSDVAAGRTRPWEEVKEELKSRFPNR